MLEDRSVEKTFYTDGSFLCLDGPAKRVGREYANTKVCFTCCDSDFLKVLLAKVAKGEECYWVKMSAKPRGGMYLGRCFFTTKEQAAQLWAKYKNHPRMMVTLQDDDFASAFRDRVASWMGKPEDALD